MLKLSGKYDYLVTMIVYKEYINKVARGMGGGWFLLVFVLELSEDQAGLRLSASDSQVLGKGVHHYTQL